MTTAASPCRLHHHAPCFVCSEGIGNQFWFDQTSGIASSRTVFGKGCQGAPGLAHGGALFAVLDEAMGLACWGNGHRVMSAKVSIEYRRAVPLEQAVDVRAWIVSVDGRKVRTRSEITDADGVMAEAEGLFVHQDRFTWPVDLVPVAGGADDATTPADLHPVDVGLPAGHRDGGR
jgi:acyl-coenzyme A thioesterase PaaI-like protein